MEHHGHRHIQGDSYRAELPKKWTDYTDQERSDLIQILCVRGLLIVLQDDSDKELIGITCILKSGKHLVQLAAIQFLKSWLDSKTITVRLDWDCN